MGGAYPRFDVAGRGQRLLVSRLVRVLAALNASQSLCLPLPELEWKELRPERGVGFFPAFAALCVTL